MSVSKVKMVVIFSVAIVTITAGVTLGVLWTSIFDSILQRELILSPTSKSFAIWKETPIPMYLKIYLFHWINPQSLGEAKPHFIEKGPYVFKEVDYKINRTWNANGTLTFNQKRIWHFLSSESNGTLEDEIVSLNPVAVEYVGKDKKKATNELLWRKFVLRYYLKKKG